MLPRVVYLYPQNTQVITIEGLQDEVSGNYLNNALVAATLLDQRGNPDPVLNNMQLGYLEGTNGNYQGTVPETFNPPAFVNKPQSGYTLQLLAIQAGVQSLFSISAVVTLRSKQ